jgi:beta-aspartyl-peptidase (threonine type)
MASEAEKHGTVGAVALDRNGNLAAATSTGGFNNKPRGRVGDSAVIGAGTYAKNGVCAVSCTGQGEFFIRHAAAYDIAARMQYAGATLQQATDVIVHETMKAHKIGAGLVAIDAMGNVLTPFNTIGMYRGAITTAGELSVGTHQETHQLGSAPR